MLISENNCHKRCVNAIEKGVIPPMLLPAQFLLRRLNVTTCGQTEQLNFFFRRYNLDKLYLLLLLPTAVSLWTPIAPGVPETTGYDESINIVV